MDDKKEVRLDNDPVGRQFRIVPRSQAEYENLYPCNHCSHGIYDIDRFCCKLLPHGFDEHNEFWGTNVFPSALLREKATKLGIHIDITVNAINFYHCSKGV